MEMDGATLMTSPWCVAASNPETRETPRMSTHPGLRETTCARNRCSRALRGRAAQMSLPNGGPAKRCGDKNVSSEAGQRLVVCPLLD